MGHNNNAEYDKHDGLRRVNQPLGAKGREGQI